MKKRNLLQIGKKALTLAMVCMVGLGLTSPALTANAADESETNATAAITKTLETGYGVVPNNNMAFTFGFEQVVTAVKDKDGKAVTPMTNSESLNDVTVTIDKDTTPYEDAADLTKRTYKAESGDILNGKTYASAGIYVYKITEKENTVTTLDADHESLSYSDATYTMYVTVANKADGSGTYIKDVTVSDDETGNKVDATPHTDDNAGVSEDDKLDLTKYDFSELEFVNKYQKYDGTKPGGGDGGDVDPGADLSKHVLAISKKVVGDTADQNKEFSFEVTLKRSAVQDLDKYYGYIVDANDKAVTGEAIEFDVSGGSATETVQLKHDQKLVFNDLEIGALFSVTEKGAAGYQPAFTVVSENANGTVTGTVAQDLTAPGTLAQYAVIGEKINNNAAFTNTIQDVTPTGIIMNNLPFFMLILAAAAALFAFAVVENRRKKLMK